MNSIDQEIYGSIFSFEIGWAETKIMWFVDLGWEPNWELKGQNRSNLKYQNEFFLMCSIWLIELKISDEI